MAELEAQAVVEAESEPEDIQEAEVVETEVLQVQDLQQPEAEITETFIIDDDLENPEED
jgi:hypothetical protein